MTARISARWAGRQRTERSTTKTLASLAVGASVLVGGLGAIPLAHAGAKDVSRDAANAPGVVVPDTTDLTATSPEILDAIVVVRVDDAAHRRTRR